MNAPVDVDAFMSSAAPGAAPQTTAATLCAPPLSGAPLTAPPPAATPLTAAPLTQSILRFSTAGSVDDGKSTLIGRLLYDSKSIFEDQLVQVERATKRLRRDSEAMRVDLSLLTDGLIAEREQGITIDVAYRYFATPKRKFIIADTPGHEQYTRNMVTGASTAGLAIVLVDARKGLSVQSKRHALVARLLGIRHVVLAVNKMDLVGYAEEVFTRIDAEFRAFIVGQPGQSSQSNQPGQPERPGQADLPDLPGAAPQIHAIPLSALLGDNVVDASANMAWYRGPVLLDLLESVDVAATLPQQAFRFPVQLVSRPQLAGTPAYHDYRGYQGRIEAGRVSVGDAVTLAPDGATTRVKDIVVFERGALRSINAAEAPQSVTLLLEHDLDISRGNLLFGGDAPVASREFGAVVCWMASEALDTRRKYLIKLGAQTVRAVFAEVASRLDVQSGQRLNAAALQLNDLGFVRIKTQQAVAFDAYRTNRATGSFIVMDEANNHTVAAGMIEA